MLDTKYHNITIYTIKVINNVPYKSHGSGPGQAKARPEANGLGLALELVRPKANQSQARANGFQAKPGWHNTKPNPPEWQQQVSGTLISRQWREHHHLNSVTSG